MCDEPRDRLGNPVDGLRIAPGQRETLRRAAAPWADVTGAPITIAEADDAPMSKNRRMVKRLFIVWHQDSPGTRVVVSRWFRPRSGFSRVGERHIATAGAGYSFRLHDVADTTKESPS